MKAMLSPFLLGVGGCDADKMLSMMDVSGGRIFRQSFGRHSSTITSGKKEICDNAINSVFKDEGIATIKSEKMIDSGILK